MLLSPLGKEALSVLMLCAPVFYIRQLSSRRGLSICRYLPFSNDSLSRVYDIFWARENARNTKILEVRHFRMIRKGPPMGTRGAKH